MADHVIHFVNESRNPNPAVVLFQQNVAAPEIAIAWRVIHPGHSAYTVNIPDRLQVSAETSFGGGTAMEETSAGNRWNVVARGPDMALSQSPDGPSHGDQIEVHNALKQGAINASIYRDGRKLATATNVAPGHAAIFQFRPALRFGLITDVAEGDVITPSSIAQIGADIPLDRFREANVVLSGGGEGPDATAYELTVIPVA